VGFEILSLPSFHCLQPFGSFCLFVDSSKTHFIVFDVVLLSFLIHSHVTINSACLHRTDFGFVEMVRALCAVID